MTLLFCKIHKVALQVRAQDDEVKCTHPGCKSKVMRDPNDRKMLNYTKDAIQVILDNASINEAIVKAELRRQFVDEGASAELIDKVKTRVKCWVSVSHGILAPEV